MSSTYFRGERTSEISNSESNCFSGIPTKFPSNHNDFQSFLDIDLVYALVTSRRLCFYSELAVVQMRSSAHC